MKTKFFVLLSLVVFISSCNYKSDEYKSLEAERDSLQKAQQAMQEEVDSYFTSMNQIEQNIEKIKGTQQVITQNSAGEEIDTDTRTKITDDLTYIHEMIKANKEELDRLRRLLKRSNFKSGELERTLTRLTKSLEEEAQKVMTLETQLAEKNAIIATMGDEINNLSKDVDELKSETSNQKSTIQDQDATIHTAWYVFGTRSELKEQKIITSQGLFKPSRVLESDFNKNYFVRIDARKTKSIPLYSSRAKILTNHPKNSYTLEKQDGSFTLLINNTADFWSISKYLVIEVD